jgi:hypothetical protein
MDSMPQETHKVISSLADESHRVDRWQLRLLPFMIGTLLGLTAFFLVVSLVQIAYLHRRIEQSPQVDLHQPISVLTPKPSSSVAESIQAADGMAKLLLEANAMERRYHQASVVLMARVWTSYLGFVTGMVLAIIGAVFILGRVQGTHTNMEAKLADANVALKTSTPGIVLAAMGVLLMITTLYVRYDITVSDRAIYIGSGEPSSQQESPKPPAVSFPTK